MLAFDRSCKLHPITMHIDIIDLAGDTFIRATAATDGLIQPGHATIVTH